ncbi:MAG: hypothetical protein N2D54_07695, partial [Chloroflexota bacterium]
MSLNPSTQETNRFKGKLTRNVLLVLLPLTIIPALLMGIVAYNRARDLLLDQLTKQLVALEDQEHQNLSAWILEKQTRFGSIVKSKTFVRAAENATLFNPNSSVFQEIRELVIDDLKSLNPSIINPLFEEFLIISPTGKVVIATEDDWEGLQLNDQHYFEDH